jgi:uncharacterized SAM-dependent methyltransferase
VLHVFNRELDGDLPVDSFAHRAVWNAAAERIEMHLVATTAVGTFLGAIHLPLEFRAGEHVVTEHSHREVTRATISGSHRSAANWPVSGCRSPRS